MNHSKPGIPEQHMSQLKPTVQAQIACIIFGEVKKKAFQHFFILFGL